jgi:cell division septum initiation protein DivIVA
MKDQLKHLQELVQDAIDKGATNVEQVHRRIAEMPFSTLEKFASGPAKKANEMSQHTIGTIYESIRSLNDKVGRLAEELLNRGDKVATAAAGETKKAVKSARTAAKKVVSKAKK